MTVIERSQASPGAAALAGGVAAGVALATTALVDGAAGFVPSLVATVGQAVIRITPGDAARAGIDAAGSSDKPLVIAGTIVLSLVAGTVIGRAAAARRVAALLGFAMFGLAGVAAAASLRSTSTLGASIAAVLAVVAGTLTLLVLLRLAPASAPGATAARSATASPSPPSPRPIGRAATRRRFLAASGIAAAGAAVLTAAGRRLATFGEASAQRAALVLPRAADSAGRAATDLRGAATPWATPTADFYRIDEALIVPRVDLDSWQLRVNGLVDHPLELSLDDLLARPLVERWVTLACVSNEIGGDLIGNARWLGVPLRSLLDEAGVDESADQVVGRSVDGFTTGFPLAAALDGRDALVAVGMNGEPLPLAHGFPARLVVPGLYGYVSATKWLREIELTTFDAFDAYWVRRGWAQRAPIKTQSRIDVPRPGSSPPAGTQAIAGVAWAQGRGIERVEVRVDEGPWRQAEIGEPPSADTWVQWSIDWDATPGEHVVQVRATDGDGVLQPEAVVTPFPDGATGWHTVRVEVRA